MTAAEAFGRKMELVLKALSMSRGRLAHDAQIDKSLVSRWVSGQTVPSAHNLEKVTRVVAGLIPGFSMLDWDLTEAELLRRVGGKPEPLAPAAPPALPLAALIFPNGVVEAARAETAKRGAEYQGIYDCYRASFGRPGRFVRGIVSIRLSEGVLEYREGARGFEHTGWALLMLNRLYCMLAEEKFESMQFTITNAGQQPLARTIGAVTLSMSSDGALTPMAAPTVLQRRADLTGDAATDAALYLSIRDSEAAYVDAADIPASILAYITRDSGPSAFAAGGTLPVTAPFIPALD